MLHYGMFIRWMSYVTRVPRRQAQSWNEYNKTRWSAVLVESVRIDGKPCQRHIACLASIREIDGLTAQCKFWERFTRKLDSLSNRVSADERRRIEAQLVRKVPCPAEEDYLRWKQRARELCGERRVKPALTHWPVVPAAV